MKQIEPHTRTIHGCYVLLKYAEVTLEGVYSGRHEVTERRRRLTDPLLAAYQPGVITDVHRSVHRGQYVSTQGSGSRGRADVNR